MISTSLMYRSAYSENTSWEHGDWIYPALIYNIIPRIPEIHSDSVRECTGDQSYKKVGNMKIGFPPTSIYNIMYHIPNRILIAYGGALETSHTKK